MEFLSIYGLFLAKLASVVLAILVILIAFFALIAKAKDKEKGALRVSKLNDQYEKYKETLSHAIKNKHELKFLKKSKKKTKKQKSKEKTSPHNIFVLTFHGDIKASAVDALRKEITAVLTTAESNDEVLLRLDSAGGLVNAYGLAASQLQRIKDAHIKLTIAIDKMAASGGYMMACVADHIIAAPFAIIGSIGVIAQLPNFHRYLQKKSIDFEQLTAGDYKRTLTLLGENTEAGRQKMQEEINDTHELFKAFIQDHRQQIDIDKVATGEHWFAARTLDLNLVDELKTSDDYLLSASQRFNVYDVEYKTKKSLGKRLASGIHNTTHKLLSANTGGQDFLP